MANQIDAIKDVDKELLNLESSLKSIQKEIIKVSELSRGVADSFKGIKTPKGINSALKQTSENTEQLNSLIKEQDRLEKNLITTLSKKELATESTNRALIKERLELQQQKKLIKEASVLSSRYSTQLQKAATTRNKLARTIQDLNVKRELGLNLLDEEQKELKQSQKEFLKYDKAVRKAKESVGRFQENVGNYPKVLNSIKGLTTGLIGAFGVIEGLKLAFDFGKEAVKLAREAKGVEFAFDRLGSVGSQAFDDIKRATRGTLSDLEIKKSINEFNNLGISLKESGTAFEFLAVRAAQTGRSVESMREDLVTGLGRGSVRILDNLGLSMAELNKLTKEQGLSIQEAFGVIAQQEIEKAGNILDEAASNQEKFNASFENFKKSAGSGFVSRLTSDIYGLLTSFSETGLVISDASDNLFEFAINSGLVSVGLGDIVKKRAEQNKEAKQRKSLLEEINKLQEKRGLSEDSLYKASRRFSQLTTENIKKVLEYEKRIAAAVEVQVKENDTVADLRKNIAFLNSEKESLTINDIERRKQIDKDIKKNQKLIDVILGVSKARKEAREKATSFLGNLDEEKAKEIEGAELFIEAMRETYKGDDSFELPELSSEDLKKSMERINKEVTEQMKQMFADEVLNESLQELTNTIEQFTGVSGESLLNFFDKLKKGGVESFEDIAEVAGASFDVIGQIANSFYENSISQYDERIDKNNEYYSKLLEDETLTDDERKRLELDRDAREKQLEKDRAKEKKKQFIANKAFAVAEIAINTAIAVAKVYGQTGIFGLAAQIPIIAMGALQTALVLSQPIPKFAEGGVMDKDGAMMINDHHSGRLEVVERNGKFLMTNKKNAIVEGKKGDIIHKDASEFFKNYTDEQILNNAKEMSFIASLNSQNSIASQVDFKTLKDINNANADKIVNAILSKKTRFNVQNNVSLEGVFKYQNLANEY